VGFNKLLQNGQTPQGCTRARHDVPQGQSAFAHNHELDTGLHEFQSFRYRMGVSSPAGVGDK